MRLGPIFTAACASLVFFGPWPSLAQPVAGSRDRESTTRGELVSGVKTPDGKLARDPSALVRQKEGELLFQHSMRVYCWATLAAKRKGFNVDPDLLYVAAMFHDFNLTEGYRQSHLRYEIDGANAAAEFLRKQGVPQNVSDFLRALYDSLKHRPETTQGTGLADVMAFEDPQFRRRDFTVLMRNSPWTAAH